MGPIRITPEAHGSSRFLAPMAGEPMTVEAHIGDHGNPLTMAAPGSLKRSRKLDKEDKITGICIRLIQCDQIMRPVIIDKRSRI